jgi:hypothetical protein
MDGELTHEQACGGTPVNGLLLAATQHHLQPQLLGHCNSGDTAGDKGRVVGYAAFAFMKPGGTDPSGKAASAISNTLYVRAP